MKRRTFVASLAASGAFMALELVGSRAATPTGVTIQVYRPTGRPQYGTATVAMNHVR